MIFQMHDKLSDVTLVHLIYAICVIMSVPLYGLVKRMSGRDKCKIAQFKMARSHVGIFIWKSAFCQFEHVSIELWPSLLTKRKHLCSTFQSICCQWALWMISFIKLKRAILANQIAFNQLATCWESAGVTVVQDDWKLRSEKRLISLLLPPGKLAVVQDTAPPDRDNAARF